MKLDEVSVGASTLKFTDYVQHMKQIGISPKVIGELHSMGVGCLKAGATFENSDEDDVSMTFKHGYVQLSAMVESKAFFKEKVEVTSTMVTRRASSTSATTCCHLQMQSSSTSARSSPSLTRRCRTFTNSG